LHISHIQPSRVVTQILKVFDIKVSSMVNLASNSLLARATDASSTATGNTPWKHQKTPTSKTNQNPCNVRDVRDGRVDGPTIFAHEKSPKI
jgi:hypothetical protein